MLEKILIAIGDKNLRDILVPKIQEAGYIVDEAYDSLEVLTKVKNFKPDLALIDINLPTVAGSELFTPEYVNKEIVRTPIIIISNSTDPIPMKRIPATPSIKDYIIKFHIEPKEVLDKLNKAFGRGIVGDIPVEKKEGEGKKILWVEDDKLLSNILSKKLERVGYTLTRVDNGKEALEFVEKETPNIIILDILLPEMNGFELLEELKKKSSLTRVPIMMLSNLSRQADIDRAKALGANRFLVKAAVSLDEILKETELEMSES